MYFLQLAFLFMLFLLIENNLVPLYVCVVPLHGGNEGLGKGVRNDTRNKLDQFMPKVCK